MASNAQDGGIEWDHVVCDGKQCTRWWLALKSVLSCYSTGLTCVARN